MKIKVLIIDDSIVFRTILSKGIQVDNDIEVVATAVDPFDARDKILEFEPDVLTCDIEMPKMDGIKFIKQLLPQYPIPIIVVSSISNGVFEAMNAGAIDFIAKPDANSPENVKSFIMELVQKIKAASKAQILNQGEPLISNASVAKGVIPEVHAPQSELKQVARRHKLIGIGASTGGTEAIFAVLKKLPLGLPGIVIVQHIPPMFSRMFAERLNNQTHFTCKEAQNGDLIENDHVYVAPGDKQMKVVTKGGKLYISVFDGEKVNGHCPSVDVLFNSIAAELGDAAMGVILTGMGYDGAKGITLMRRKGAITLGQDEQSSVVYGMPKAAFMLNGITKQTSLELMSHYIVKYLS